MQAAREAGRRAACRSNLRQFGIALHQFHAAQKHFPPGCRVRWRPEGIQFFANANILLLPYLEQQALAEEFRYGKEPWEQSIQLVTATVDILSCPSNGSQPFIDPVLASAQSSIGSSFATTDYAFSKGSTDAWCPASKIEKSRWGAFQLDERVSIREIEDGLSNTLFIGEAAGGEHWPICLGVGCREPSGGVKDGSIPWFTGHVMPTVLSRIGYNVNSVYASTLEPMNKRPITAATIDLKQLADCRSSSSGAPTLK